MNLIDQQNLKIKLEGRFRNEVRRLFIKIKSDYRVGVSTGIFIRAERYRPRFLTLLDKHYGRVQEAFGSIVATDTKAQEQDESLEDEIAIALLAWSDDTGKTMTTEMIHTTQNEMDDAITLARQSLSNEGNHSFSTRELAVVSATILGRKFKGREESIVISETQKAAESTKLIEAYGEAGLSPRDAVLGTVGTLGTLAKKEWHDVGDAKVRRGHHAGEVAKVPINQPFLVRGEFLMFPGDTSLGASAGNTINCRCGSLYTFGG